MLQLHGDATDASFTFSVGGADLLGGEPNRGRFKRAIDGRLADIDSELPAHLMPLISDHWGRNFRWRGLGEMPEQERQKLRGIVKKIHQNGRRVRFWATPEDSGVWSELLDVGVGVIGIDDLVALSQFLRTRND